MSDWTNGYVSDIGYTYGYYRELNPLRVKLAFLNAGLIAPEFGVACELGFGQGVSAAMHAAASVCTWYGTDFNPSQAGFAQELAASAELNAHLYDESFAEFAKRDLPEFDYIGLHGIWSWISDENRSVIVDFIRRKLKVGGVVYISYNTQPGWAAFAPMRHLMTEHAEVLGAPGTGILKKIDNSLGFLADLLAATPMFARANPSVNERFKQIQNQNKNYLAHEYFNQDWHPMYFASMVKWLQPAKLTYASSANYLDNIDVLNLTTEQQVFLASIEDSNFKQSIFDFLVNQTFRRDYWVKGPRRLNAFERADALRRQYFVLVTHSSDISLKVNGLLGEANLTQHIYEPIIQLLSDYKVRSLSEIEVAVKEKGITFSQLNQVILVLAGCGYLYPAHDNKDIARPRKNTERLNDHLLLRSINSNDITQLASPIIGGGFPVGRFQQLFILSMRRGGESPHDWAKFACDILMRQGEKILKNGLPLETYAENLKELNLIADEFSEKRIPILKTLAIL